MTLTFDLSVKLILGLTLDTLHMCCKLEAHWLSFGQGYSQCGKKRGFLEFGELFLTFDQQEVSAQSHWAIRTKPKHIWLAKSSLSDCCEHLLTCSSTVNFLGPGMVGKGTARLFMHECKHRSTMWTSCLIECIPPLLLPSQKSSYVCSTTYNRRLAYLINPQMWVCRIWA